MNWSTDWSVGLPVGCNSCQLLYQGETVDRLVDRFNQMVVWLDAVAASYRTTGNDRPVRTNNRPVQ